jgi:ATP phosphoribosyltransferase
MMLRHLSFLVNVTCRLVLTGTTLNVGILEYIAQVLGTSAGTFINTTRERKSRKNVIEAIEYDYETKVEQVK